jgi:hypothetical protein
LIQKSDLKAIAKNAVDESTKMLRQPMRAAYTDDATNGNYYIAIVPHFMEKGKLNFKYEFNSDVLEPVTKKLQSKFPSICSFLTYRKYKDKISSSKIEDMFEYYEDPEAEQMEGCEEDYANEVNDNDFILVPRRKPKMLPATNKTCSEGFRCTNGRTCNKEHTYEKRRSLTFQTQNNATTTRQYFVFTYQHVGMCINPTSAASPIRKRSTFADHVDLPEIILSLTARITTSKIYKFISLLQ